MYKREIFLHQNQLMQERERLKENLSKDDGIKIPLSNSVASALDSLHDLRHILLAGIVVGSLYHDAHDRFCAGLAHQNTTGVAKCISHILDSACTALSSCAAFLSVTRTFSNTCG